MSEQIPIGSKPMAWKHAKALFGGAVAVMVTALPASADLEGPAYKVLEREGAIEIRQYQGMAAAEVTVVGSRSAATRRAFNILFGYISGKNEAETEVSMTAPVRQEPASTKIAMTAPVVQTGSGSGSWKVSFYLPSEYTEATAPRPTDSRVSIVTMPGQKVAAITFSGRWTDRNFRQNERDLMAFLKAREITPAGQPVYAYFNDPFTPPPFRRNEVQFVLSDSASLTSSSRP